MKNLKSKTIAIAIITVLMISASAALVSIPSVKAKTTFRMDQYYTPYTGLNGETALWIVPTPNFFMTDPAYPYTVGAMIWPNATFTLTRPDNTTKVINGPFNMRARTIGGVTARLEIIFTPDMQGNWTSTFYWPGDDTYNAVTSWAYFVVGPHFPRREVWAYVTMRPYPNTGLGQDVLINAWLTPPPPVSYANFQGYMFTFTRPDGTSFQVGPMDSEGPGVVWFNLPLDQLGNWSIKFDFPGDWLSLPATVTRYINVVNEWSLGYPDTPLPTDRPLTFPINTQNREWRTVAGPWYQTQYNCSVGAWNPYTEAPKTAHVLWKLPAYSGIGGYVGSPTGITTGGANINYGGSDVGLYTASVPTIRTVMAGRGYYTNGTHNICIDMRTGKQLWAVLGSFNVGATRSRLPVLIQIGNNLTIYNGLDGAVILNTTGLATYSFFDDPFVYRSEGGRLIKWTTAGTSTNFASRIIWNVTDPAYHPQSGGGGLGRYSFSAIQNGIWCSLDTAGPDPYIALNNGDKFFIGVNVTTGAIVYQNKVSNPADPYTWMYRQGPMAGSGYGLWYQAFIPNENEGRGWTAFDVATGTKKWTSEITDYPWGNFWAYMPEASANGYIIGSGYSGVWAFNATNGKIGWHYIDNDTYNEEPYESNIIGSTAYPNSLNLSAGETYASYAFGSTGAIVGGDVVYAPNTEHSATFYYRGMGLSAINSFTGEGIWRIKGTWVPTAVAYGVLLASNAGNGYTYAFGKGETETTVTTSSKVITKGENVLLEGTVLDMSTAQPGTAAVSDSSQEGWMEYLHMQQPYPVSASGVAVSLDTLDPNNNYVHIGDTTTDLTGQYSFGWKPEIEGKYTIIASFYTTEAYYGSTAETAMFVGEAPAAVEPVEPAAPVDYTMTLVYLAVAIIAVIAIVGALLMLMLRKR